MKKIFTLSFIIANSIMSFAQTTIPNGGFETWDGSGASIEPTNYNSNKSGTGLASLGPQTCFQDNTVVHSGTYSVRIETGSTLATAVNGALTSGLVNAPSTNKAEGYIGTMQGASGTDIRRIAFNGRPDSLIGFYRYTQSTSTSGTGGANEKGKVYAILHLGNYYDPSTPVNGNHPDSSANKIGDALFVTPAANAANWTRFSVPFNYTSSVAPQYILLNCTSSNDQMTSVAGSKLWLDDIAVVYNGAGINDNYLSENNVNVYSGNKTIYVDFLNKTDNEFTLSVFDLGGKLVLEQKLNNNKLNSVNVSTFKTGMYLYQLTGKDDFKKSGKLTIE